MIKKLIEVQKELKAPKSQYNGFGKYNYRNCEDILEAVKPLLAKQGLALYLTDDVVMVGDRYYVKATATVTDGEKSISVTASAREEKEKKGMDGSQVTGASSSYARKYALNGLFCIDDTKDSDTAKYFCEVCNKEVSEKWAKQGLEKHGHIYCSKECKELDAGDKH